MINYAIVLFLIGAVGGLAMAIKSFRGRPIPWMLAIGHGLFGAAGLLVLAYAVLQGIGGRLALVALLVLLVAALGGFFLLSYHIRKKDHPRAVIVVHALVAVVGVLTLIATVLYGQAA